MSARTGRHLAEYDTARQRADDELHDADGAWDADEPMRAAHHVSRAQALATLANAAATALLADTVAGEVA